MDRFESQVKEGRTDPLGRGEMLHRRFGRHSSFFPVTQVSFTRSSFLYLRFLISKMGIMVVLDLLVEP